MTETKADYSTTDTKPKRSYEAKLSKAEWQMISRLRNIVNNGGDLAIVELPKMKARKVAE